MNFADHLNKTMRALGGRAPAPLMRTIARTTSSDRIAESKEAAIDLMADFVIRDVLLNVMSDVRRLAWYDTKATALSSMDQAHGRICEELWYSLGSTLIISESMLRRIFDFDGRQKPGWCQPDIEIRSETVPLRFQLPTGVGITLPTPTLIDHGSRTIIVARPGWMEFGNTQTAQMNVDSEGETSFTVEAKADPVIRIDPSRLSVFHISF